MSRACKTLLSGPGLAGLFGLLALGVSCPSPAAADYWHELSFYALHAKALNAKPALPWLYRFSVRGRPGDIRRADDARLMSRPRIVRSIYDSSAQYDITKFYEPQRPQINVVMNYAGRRAGEIFSFGLDAGYASKKIEIKPALFLGYTRAFQMTKQTHIALGMNGWFGGKVSERPCLDSYQREYHCPTLSAWSDYRQPDYSMDVHYNLVFRHSF